MTIDPTIVVNEGASAFLTVSFFDQNNTPQTPNSCTFSVHDSSGTELISETPVTGLSTSVVIEMTPAANTMVSTGMGIETRVVTVKAIYSNGSVTQDEYNYNLKRLKFPQ